MEKDIASLFKDTKPAEPTLEQHKHALRRSLMNKPARGGVSWLSAFWMQSVAVAMAVVMLFMGSFSFLSSTSPEYKRFDSQYSFLETRNKLSSFKRQRNLRPQKVSKLQKKSRPSSVAAINKKRSVAMMRRKGQ